MPQVKELKKLELLVKQRKYSKEVAEQAQKSASLYHLLSSGH